MQYCWMMNKEGKSKNMPLDESRAFFRDHHDEIVAWIVYNYSTAEVVANGYNHRFRAKGPRFVQRMELAAGKEAYRRASHGL